AWRTAVARLVFEFDLRSETFTLRVPSWPVEAALDTGDARMRRTGLSQPAAVERFVSTLFLYVNAQLPDATPMLYSGGANSAHPGATFADDSLLAHQCQHNEPCRNFDALPFAT